jgi:hypothetical protein
MSAMAIFRQLTILVLIRVVDSYDFEHASALLRTEKFSEAWEYALPFASAGDSNAQCLMALLNENGLGVAVNLDQAESWLRKAAEQNNPVAWNNLGTHLLRKGENGNAKKCYQQAVELGFTMAVPLAK